MSLVNDSSDLTKLLTAAIVASLDSNKNFFIKYADERLRPMPT